MNKSLLLILAFAFNIAFAQEYKVASNPQLIQEKLMSTSKTSETLQASFTQEKHMSILNKPFISNGVFYYKQPEKVRWEYQVPFTYVVVLRNNHVSIKDGDDLQNYDMSKNAIFKEINKVMSGMLNGKMLEDKSFSNTIYENDTKYKAVLIPLIPSVKDFIQEIHLYFNKVSNQIEQVEMRENGGDKTIIKFKDVTVNKVIEENVFTDI